MVYSVLTDYMTIGCASEVLRPAFLFINNPFISKSQIPSTSVIWIYLSSLSTIIENIILFEKLSVLPLNKNGRRGKLGKLKDEEDFKYFSKKDGDLSNLDICSFLITNDILEEIDLSEGEFQTISSMLSSLACSNEFCASIIQSYFSIIMQPTYEIISALSDYSPRDSDPLWREFSSYIKWDEFKKILDQVCYKMQLPKFGGITKDFEDMVAFILRALQYNEIAKIKRLPYVPHPTRTPIVMSDGLSSIDKSQNYGKVAIEHIEDLRKELAQHRNQYLKRHIYDLKIPALFSLVLRESSNPMDFLPVAKQIRDTKGAISLRQWSHGVSDAILKGDSKGINNFINDLEGLIDSLKKEIGLKKEEVSISIWMFGFPIKVPKFLQKVIIPPGKHHLQFLRDLFRNVEGIKNIEGELIRVFKNEFWLSEKG